MFEVKLICHHLLQTIYHVFNPNGKINEISRMGITLFYRANDGTIVISDIVIYIECPKCS